LAELKRFEIGSYGNIMVTRNSVEKALTILMAFVPHNRTMGSSELSRMLGFSNSTVNRLLHILVSFDFVRQDPATKKFSLGKSAVQIGYAVGQSLSTEVVSIAKPYCDKLRDEIGETVALELLSGDSTVLAYHAPSLNPVSVLVTHRTPGEKYSVNVAAGAKAILAFSPPEMVDRIIKGKLERFTPNTITKPSAFKQHLEQIKERGISIDDGEYHIEVCAIGAPIFNAFKKPVAGLVIAAPFYRSKSLLASSTTSRLKAVALEISTKLLYSEE
jgi:DNA-binding IclR family transcriptional regulator